MNTIDFASLFSDINVGSKKLSYDIFQKLKTPVERYLRQYMASLTKRGRPQSLNINELLDAYYEAADNGSKMFYLKQHYPHSSDTSKRRYFKMIGESGVFEIINKQLLDDMEHPQLLITDSTNCRSNYGSVGVAYNYKEPNKKGVKLALITGLDNIIHYYCITAANVDDKTTVKDMIAEKPSDLVFKILGDRGYVGRDFHQYCSERRVTMVAHPKKNRNGQQSHTLTYRDSQLLKRNRSKVEHVNAQLKQFRGLSVKTQKLVERYKQICSLVITLTNCRNRYVTPRKLQILGSRAKKKIRITVRIRTPPNPDHITHQNGSENQDNVVQQNTHL